MSIQDAESRIASICVLQVCMTNPIVGKILMCSSTHSCCETCFQALPRPRTPNFSNQKNQSNWGVNQDQKCAGRHLAAQERFHSTILYCDTTLSEALSGPSCAYSSRFAPAFAWKGWWEQAPARRAAPPSRTRRSGTCPPDRISKLIIWYAGCVS